MYNNIVIASKASCSILPKLKQKWNNCGEKSEKFGLNYSIVCINRSKKSCGRTESTRRFKRCNVSYFVQEKLFISSAIEPFLEVKGMEQKWINVIFPKEKSCLITSRWNVRADTRKAFKMRVLCQFLTRWRCGRKIIYYILHLLPVNSLLWNCVVPPRLFSMSPLKESAYFYLSDCTNR